MLSSDLSPHHPSTITDFLYPRACALRTRAVGQVFKGAVTLKVPMKTNLTIFYFLWNIAVYIINHLAIIVFFYSCAL